MKKPTTIDYIILGLIQQESLTGYRIRKTFEDTALGNFGGSPGTIYPALKRLEKNKLISKENIDDGKKSKYLITNAGLGQLRMWLHELPTASDVKKSMDLLVLKFAFMDTMIPTEKKIAYLEALKYELEDYLKELKHYFRNEKNTMPVSGRIAFKHGLLSYQSSIEWCIQAKKSILNSN